MIDVEVPGIVKYDVTFKAGGGRLFAFLFTSEVDRLDDFTVSDKETLMRIKNGDLSSFYRATPMAGG